MEYFVRFIDKAGNKYDWCLFGVSQDETFLDKLEEVLYIMSEITPVHRNWKRDLLEDGKCLFTYHNVEHAVVEWREGDDKGITVRDV